MLHVSRVIYSGKTRYQEVDIVESPDLGKCLIIDGAVQSSTFDEYIYHESLVHPAMLTAKDPKNVLVVGGGEGATMREILKYDVQKVKVIDIDEELIELCKKHLEEMHKGSFYDERVEIIFTDGMRYIEDNKDRYDVIILDVTDPTEGTSQPLYTKEFYSLLKDRLNDGGCIVTQATSPQFSTDCFTIIHNTMEQVFKYVRAYNAPVRSYGGLWGFVVASDYQDPLDADKNFDRIKGELLFYDKDNHKALFALGRNVKKMLDEEDRIATRDNMIYMPAMPNHPE
jgi:spermidine synthase